MAPNGDDVRRQLDRLLASSGFTNAGRMSRFLRFVVERTLAGEGERLKEYVIGIEVFDRETDYDPRVDSIVRVEAARLRTKLTEYYAGEGRGDSIVLSLPKGGYSPVIKLSLDSAAANGAATNGTAALASGGSPSPAVASTQPAPPPHRRSRGWLVGAVLAGAAALAVAAWSPWASLTPASKIRVAVLPFTPYPDGAGTQAEAVAMRITEGVTAELVRAGRFEVVASTSAREVRAASQRARDVATALDADVLVEARVLAQGDHVRVEARAVSGNREEKFWVEDFAGSAVDSNALEREIAGAITAALARVESRD
jgi:TolB-like protein